MIVTVGKHIRIKSGKFNFSRTAESPGAVTVNNGDGAIVLPGNVEDAEEFIAAYRRALKEDIVYRDQGVE